MTLSIRSRGLAVACAVVLAACEEPSGIEQADPTPSRQVAGAIIGDAGGAPEPMTVQLLDVGQGDAILISNGTSRVLVDGGRTTSRMGALLDSLGLNRTTLEAVVLSHVHVDHAAGLVEIFKASRGITVRHFFDNGDTTSSTNVRSVRDSARARAARGVLTYRDADDPCDDGSAVCTLRLAGGGKVHVMRPKTTWTNPDQRSIPVKVVGPDSASFTMWLAGDAWNSTFDWYVDEARYDLDPGVRVNVWKGGEHGACRGTSARFLGLANPDWAVFSLGANTSQLVHEQLKDLLRASERSWYRTDENGTISIRTPGTPGGGYTIGTQRGSADMDGAYDAVSTQRSCQWPLVPTAPTALVGSVAAAARVEVSWQDNSTTEVGFEVQRDAGGGSWTAVGTTPPSVTALADAAVEPGRTYVYRVRAFNDGGKSAPSNTVAVTVPASDVNRAPHAQAGGPYAATEGEPVQLDGSGSVDADGDAITFSWQLGDGAVATGVSPQHAYADDGTYTVVLTVTDSRGAASTAAPVFVVVRNAAPVVAATLSEPTVLTGQSVGLSGSFADAGSGDAPWSYVVDWGDGVTTTGTLATSGTAITGSHSYTVAGDYTVQLSVVDKDGAVGAVGRALVVAMPPAPNRAPVAIVSGSHTALEGALVTLDGSASYDPDGDAVTYSWSFGDGSTGTGVAPQHRYIDDGTYTVTLTVTDAGGAAGAPALATVAVANVDPSVAATLSATTVSIGATTTLTGSFSDPGTADGPWSYVVDWGNGASSVGTVASPASSIVATHAYAAAGDYTVQLRITDQDGGVGTTRLDVTVSAPAPQPAFPLATRAYKERGIHKVDLTWSWKVAPQVEIRRSGQVVARVANGGRYTDTVSDKGTFTYQVCAEGDRLTCSTTATVKF